MINVHLPQQQMLGETPHATSKGHLGNFPNVIFTLIFLLFSHIPGSPPRHPSAPFPMLESTIMLEPFHKELQVESVYLVDTGSLCIVPPSLPQARHPITWSKRHPNCSILRSAEWDRKTGNGRRVGTGAAAKLDDLSSIPGTM